jgi:hypothetical protein
MHIACQSFRGVDANAYRRRKGLIAKDLRKSLDFFSSLHNPELRNLSRIAAEDFHITRKPRVWSRWNPISGFAPSTNLVLAPLPGGSARLLLHDMILRLTYTRRADTLSP